MFAKIQPYIMIILVMVILVSLSLVCTIEVNTTEENTKEEKQQPFQKDNIKKEVLEKDIAFLKVENILLKSKNKKLLEENEYLIKKVQAIINPPLIYIEKPLLMEKFKISNKDFKCLALNVFNEAGVESHIGKIAVIQVTMNRLNTKRWGDSICDVVYANAQFSWTLDEDKKYKIPEGKLWERSIVAVNEYIDKGIRVNGLENVLFYHTDYVNPYWSKTKSLVKYIGRHLFFV
jgi:spore germination cell wall hydrolase CwlJ-like protein